MLEIRVENVRCKVGVYCQNTHKGELTFRVKDFPSHEGPSLKTLEYNNTIQYHLFKHDGRNAAATYADVVVYLHLII